MELPSELIRNILEAESDLTFADDLYIGREPTDPDNCVVIFDAPGEGSQLVYEKNTGKNTERYESASVNIRVRNKAYDKGMVQSQEIVNILHNRGNEVVSSSWIGKIESMDNPFLMGWDDNDRARFSMNFGVEHREHST